MSGRLPRKGNADRHKDISPCDVQRFFGHFFWNKFDFKKGIPNIGHKLCKTDINTL